MDVQAATRAPARRTIAAPRWSTPTRLAIVALVVLGPIVAPLTAQPASRVSLTAALADHGTVDLGRYASLLGVDHAKYDGHLRSDKGPGQPALAVPAYLLARLVGAEPIAHVRKTKNLTAWWLTLWSGVVPFALLLGLMWRAAARVAPRNAVAVSLALGAGTIVMPHAINLYAHALSALLGFAAYELVRGRPPLSAARAAASGFLAAAAVATEYHLAIVAAVVVVVVALTDRRRLAAWVAGAATPLAGLALYQWRAFGAPWHSPFAYYAGTLGGTSRGGYGFPRPDWFFDAVLSTRGLLGASPIVLVGVVAGVLVARRRDGAGGARDAVVALAVAAGYLALVSGWSGTPWLEEPGPRYLIPMIPFLAAPLAWAWERWRAVCRVAAGYGMALMLAASTTYLLVARGDTPFHAYVSRVADLRFLPTVWSMALGPVGAFVHLVTAVVSIGWFTRTEWPEVLRTHVRSE